MEHIKLTKKELENIIVKAFKMGESWGVTYQSWFQPTKDDHKRRIFLAKNEIFKDL